MNRGKKLLGDPQEGRRRITWQILLPGHKEPRSGLGEPQGGADFWLAFSGQSLKRAAPGEKPLLGSLRVRFGMGGVRPESGIGPQAEDSKHLGHRISFRYKEIRAELR